jgi:hypothetical protein
LVTSIAHLGNEFWRLETPRPLRILAAREREQSPSDAEGVEHAIKPPPATETPPGSTKLTIKINLRLTLG